MYDALLGGIEKLVVMGDWRMIGRSSSQGARSSTRLGVGRGWWAESSRVAQI